MMKIFWFKQWKNIRKRKLKNKYLLNLSYYSCSTTFGVFEQLQSEDHGSKDGSSGLMVERQRQKEMRSEENTRGKKLGKMKGRKREEGKK